MGQTELRHDGALGSSKAGETEERTEHEDVAGDGTGEAKREEQSGGQRRRDDRRGLGGCLGGCAVELRWSQLRGLAAYSPECVEVEFSQLRLGGSIWEV